MNGRELLAAYLAEKRLTHEAFAEKAGIPAPQISLWLSGERRPGLDNAFKLEEATGGSVPASSWRAAGGKSKRKPTRGRRAASRRSAVRLVRRQHEESLAHPKP